MDDQKCIALVETRAYGSDDSLQQLIRYQVGNHLGSASLELDDQARIISYEEYYPYGSTSYQAVRTQTNTPKRYRYSGKERDEENDLYYHGARYYAPWLGRWTAVDPIEHFRESPYIGMANNPVKFNDTFGEAVEDRTTETGDSLWASYKKDLEDIRDQSIIDMRIAKIRLKHASRELTRTGRYLETQAAMKDFSKAQKRYRVAMKAMKEARQLEQSSEIYVIMHNANISAFGVLSTVLAPAKEQLAGKLVISINPNKSREEQIMTLAHEAVHAYDYEIGRVGVLYDPHLNPHQTVYYAESPDPTYDITDEVRAFQREQDLFGKYEGKTINAALLSKTMYGPLAQQRPTSVTMSTKRKTDNLLPGEFSAKVAHYKAKKGDDVTHREFYRLWAQYRAEKGLPLGRMILYKGWQEDYSVMRFIKGFGLGGIK